MIQQLEERAKQFVREQEGNINVDWKALAELKRQERYGQGHATKVIDNILKFLKQRKILVYDNTPGSYFATGCGVPLFPRPSKDMTTYAFADEKNAREYYANFFKEAQYAIILHKTIGDVEKAKE